MTEITEERDTTEQNVTPTDPPEKTVREPVLKHFVGYWHYGVILTYLALTLAICAICFAAASEPRSDLAAFFILLSGLCDAFDGTVAKTRKNRSDNDRQFGMNIDSLCDMASFGVAPIMVGIAMGMTQWYYCIVYVLFVLCGLIRLAYHDVAAASRLKNPSDARDSYSGLPITSISLSLPVFYLLATMFDVHPEWIGLTPDTIIIYQSILMMTCYAVSAFLFVFKFKMKKFRLRGLIITVATITVLVISLALIRYYVCGVVLFAPLS